MANYGTERVVLQNTTGAILSTSGDPIISTVSDSDQAIVFGAVSTREIQTAIANGGFDSQPPQPDADIDESSNPLAFWTVNDGSTGAITARSVVEPTNASGYTIGITVPNATASGLYWELSTFFPITGNSADVLAVDPIVYLDAVVGAGTPNIDVVLTMEFADTNFTTVGTATLGTATYASLITASIAPAEKSVSTTTVIAPSEAAYGKITIKVITTAIVATPTFTPIVYIREAMIRRGFSYIPISDNVASSRPAASISHSGGILAATSGSRVLDGSGTIRLVADYSGSGTAATIDLVNATNASGPFSTYNSAIFTMSGRGTSPGFVLSSTESAGDVNLFRNTANEWKTDDSFNIAGNLVVGGSATITGALSAGGISFTNLDVSGTANIVGTATFGTTVNFTGGSVNIGADGNLYRSATNTIKTDDSLVVGGGLTVGGTVIYGVPPGVVQSYLGATANVPTGWLLANGASLSTATYPALFAVIGYSFGGAGASFSLPSLTGHLLVGSTSTPGSSFQTGSVDAYLNSTWNHTHSVDPVATNSGVPSATTTILYASGANTVSPGSSLHTHSTNIAATTSSDAGPADVLRTRVVYIIKT
jgi:microcystin-dependent protein